MKRFALLLALALVAAACGGGDTGSDAEPDESPAPTEAATQDTEAPADDPEPAADEEPDEEPADEPAAAGDFFIKLTIGDETWEFPGALCAFYNAPAGEEGSEWNVSKTEDGLQVYFNFDPAFEGDASLFDTENGANPTVHWESFGDALNMSVDGDTVTGTGTFTDNVNGGTAEGSFEAHCNGWFDAT